MSRHTIMSVLDYVSVIGLMSMLLALYIVLPAQPSHHSEGTYLERGHE